MATKKEIVESSKQEKVEQVKKAKTETTNEKLIEAAKDSNIGKKKPSPVSHSSIAMLPEVDEKEELKNKFEENAKKKKLGIDKDEDDFSDVPSINGDAVNTNSRSTSATRFDVNIEKGLSDEQVNQRISEGLTNDTPSKYSKTYKEIYFGNIFTFFNVLCLIVAAALIYVKEYKNLTFLLILTINTVIGIVQETKAKKTIDKLSIVTAPTTKVVRNSLTSEIPVKELVLDDIVKFKNGKQISADCKIIEGEIEVNESLLTGESIAVKKGPGSMLYAGSFVTSGSCVAKVEEVGQDCYIQKLQAKAKKYTKPKSELLRSLKLITTFITIVLIPLGTIVAVKNYQAATISVPDPTFGSSGLVEVYGIDANNNAYPIGELTNILSENTSILTVDASDNAVLFSQIKISYDRKANGNLSISSIKVSEVEEDSNGNPTYNVIRDWKFDDATNLHYASANGISTYLDGSLKLDDTGDYVITESFSPTSKLYIQVGICSRGYGYDKTPEEAENVQNQIIRITVTKTAGSLVGMIPAGLFLLVTIALAVSVVKLANSKTLVQELYCIEMLARVDCICLDKTGTITDGTMKVKEIIDIEDEPIIPVDEAMGAFLGAFDDNNLTSIALQDRFGVNFDYKKVTTIPFSSARKLSAVTFEDIGTFVLGAPEFVYQGKSKKIETLVTKKSAMGYRVLMLAHSDKPIMNGKVPPNCSPVSIIILEDHIRPEAIDTITWFKENGVQVKVISGDNPATVAEIAGKVGIDGASDYISLEGLSPQEVETIANEYTVFGRVSPDQKAILIRSLKRHGKTVAMTGDGVNDILAMKESDCSVAMASGSEAARNVAHLVLLDSNFANMPKVVLEGRRVINNIQSSSSLYLMKTLFVMVITFLSIIATNIFKGYPFEPIQFMPLETFIIGLPSTILALQPNKEKIKGSFIVNIFSSCATQALLLIVAVVLVYLFGAQPIEGINLSSLNEINSIATIALTFVGFVILVNICRPLNTLRTIVCVSCGALIAICFLVPEIASYFISFQFNDLTITNKLFLLVIILGSIPIERAFSDVIQAANNRRKKVIVKEDSILG